ncbi:hypothetical protein AAMO2058_000546300 [Amorphochlora amoebiformis]
MEGYRSNGLIHISQLSNRRVEEAEEVVQVGEEVFVKVVKVQEEGGRVKIGLSLKDVSQDNGRDLNPSNQPSRGNVANPDAYPTLYTVHQGNVVSIRDFGVFVKLNGYHAQGLVHISQMAKWKVDNPTDIVDVGARVWVKVVGVTADPKRDDGRKKLALSMKLVSQDDGEDLDASNIEAEALTHRARQTPQDSKRIELGAILNVTCTKCGGHGHLATQCFTGKKYDLLEEEDAKVTGVEESRPPVVEAGDATKKKKKKKKKKEKKEKKDKKKKKKKLKKKKHKKKKGSSSDSDSDSEEGNDGKTASIEKARAILAQLK